MLWQGGLLPTVGAVFLFNSFWGVASIEAVGSACSRVVFGAEVQVCRCVGGGRGWPEGPGAHQYMPRSGSLVMILANFSTV